MVVLRGRTYYLDMGSNVAATGAPCAVLDASFLLLGSSTVRELADLEKALKDDQVSRVFEFKALACQVMFVWA